LDRIEILKHIFRPFELEVSRVAQFVSNYAKSGSARSVFAIRKRFLDQLWDDCSDAGTAFARRVGKEIGDLEPTQRCVGLAP